MKSFHGVWAGNVHECSLKSSIGKVRIDKTVLIGAHYRPEVRRVLFLVQAEPENEGKTLKQLLGEAINDLCAKYRKPQPYNGEP